MFKGEVEPLHKVLRVKVVHAPEKEVVHAPLVVHEEDKGSSRHGKYLDEATRKKYRKEWMKVKRAVKSGRAEAWPLNPV